MTFLKKLLFAGACLLAFASYAKAQKGAEEFVFDARNEYRERLSTDTLFLYKNGDFLIGVEEQSNSNSANVGVAVKAKTGRLSAQFDGSSKSDGQIKFVYGNDYGFSAVGGMGVREDKDICYGALKYMWKPFSSSRNLGFSVSAAKGEKRKSGVNVFGRIGRLFAGYNRAPEATKYVISMPGNGGMAFRWSGVRTGDVSYDQWNFTYDSAVLTPVDSVRAMQDKILSPEESPAIGNLNPLRFKSRADERGRAPNIQVSRKKARGKTSYAAEVDLPVAGYFWLGGTYNNENGGEYGIAAGNGTEHPRYGPRNTKFGVRFDYKHNIKAKNNSLGIQGYLRF